MKNITQKELNSIKKWINLGTLLEEIEECSKIYHLTFTFDKGYHSFFIDKDGIELKDEGGFETIKETIEVTLKYLNRITGKIK